MFSLLVEVYKKHARQLPKDPPTAEENNAVVIQNLLKKPGEVISGKIILEKKSVLRAKLQSETPKQALRRLLSILVEKGLGEMETLEGQHPVSQAIYYNLKFKQLYSGFYHKS